MVCDTKICPLTPLSSYVMLSKITDLSRALAASPRQGKGLISFWHPILKSDKIKIIIQWWKTCLAKDTFRLTSDLTFLLLEAGWFFWLWYPKLLSLFWQYLVHDFPFWALKNYENNIFQKCWSMENQNSKSLPLNHKYLISKKSTLNL